MEDHSRLRGAEVDHEKKGLMAEEGTPQQKSGQELLDRMKYIAKLITDVRYPLVSNY